MVIYCHTLFREGREPALKQRHSLFSIPSVALACLISGQAVGYAAEPPEIRLSGTILISPELRIAVIEYEDGRSYRVRAGDMLEEWGRVTEIGHDRMSIESPDGSKVMLLSGKSGVIVLPPEPPREAPARHHATSSNASPELVDEIMRLVDLGTATGDDLNYIVAPLLDLPSTARIVGVDHQPLSADDASIRQIHQALDRGNAVRLSVEGADDLKTIYLFPGNGESEGNTSQPVER